MSRTCLYHMCDHVVSATGFWQVPRAAGGCACCILQQVVMHAHALPCARHVACRAARIQPWPRVHTAQHR